MSEMVDYSIVTFEDKMPVITAVQSLIPDKPKEPGKSTRTYMVKYGPILIRKRDSLAPTLATGRRPQDVFLEGDDLEKLEIRRAKNREAARNLKKLRDNIEHDLAQQVKILETEEKTLHSRIETLENQKRQLQEENEKQQLQQENQKRQLQQECQKKRHIYQKITEAEAAMISAEFKRKKALRHVVPKEERRPPSPQWQLSFLI